MNVGRTIKNGWFRLFATVPSLQGNCRGPGSVRGWDVGWGCLEELIHKSMREDLWGPPFCCLKKSTASASIAPQKFPSSLTSASPLAAVVPSSSRVEDSTESSIVAFPAPRLLMDGARGSVSYSQLAEDRLHCDRLLALRGGCSADSSPQRRLLFSTAAAKGRGMGQRRMRWSGGGRRRGEPRVVRTCSIENPG
jgi:hypothetical protein